MNLGYFIILSDRLKSPLGHNKYVALAQPELKYENSRPIALIGLNRLEKSETTPKLTSMFRNRPSHIKATSCKERYSIDVN